MEQYTIFSAKVQRAAADYLPADFVFFTGSNWLWYHFFTPYLHLKKNMSDAGRFFLPGSVKIHEYPGCMVSGLGLHHE